MTDNVGPDRSAPNPTDTGLRKLPTDAEPVLTGYELSTDYCATLSTLAARLRADALSEPIRFARQAHLASRELPGEIATVLHDFEVSGGGLLLFSGAATGPLPNTPDTPMSQLTHKTSIARQAAIISACVGHLVGFRCESAGRLCQTIVPVFEHRRAQMSTGSVGLECHTEQCFNSISRPDFFTLACLRGDPTAVTYALSAQQIESGLSAKTIELLRENQFYTRVDDSFVRGGLDDRMRGPMPVLFGPREDPIVRYDEDLMIGATIAHTAALGALRDLWQQARISVVLRPGDVLILDNSRVVHGRSPYYPQYDGGDRWLARWQVAKALTHTRFARAGSSPIIEAIGC
ncbi:TauD/TfdA family dioxygenase [Nocardia gamkensis]|uniref:TauD/TfdA family dioxygenase n=1 Tax=Nocardia gamkensis TaxID=352869 RepID=UPI0033E1D991